jgi:hypothetical protein
MAVKKQTTRKTESPKVSKPKDQGAAVIVKLQRPPLFNPMTGKPAKRYRRHLNHDTSGLHL